ncbi:MAG: hypothetical protein V1484_00290 [bacterium]
MKSKIITPKLGWIIVVLVILGIFAYLVFSSNYGIVYGPNIIIVTEGTQGFKNNLKVGVANIQNGSGIVYLSSKTDNTSKDVKTGDNFDFQNYHIQVFRVKENTRILPVGWTGGNNGFITFKITEK